MSSPKKLAHLVLKTYDVAGMREFYCCLLDAHVVFEHLPVVSFITYDDEHHRLGFTLIGDTAKPSPPDAPGLTHVAFTYGSIRELLSNYERLRDQGIKPAVTINHGPTISFYYSDPDKNNVELLTDRLSFEDAVAFMETPTFRNNHMGIEVNPDELVAKMHGGASDEDLMHYDETARPDLAEMAPRFAKLMHLA